jgi:protein involved in polysaccharide export with SLBB domain
MTNRTFHSMTRALGVALVLVSTTAFAEDYKLGASDRLRIRVQEWPDLNGEYTVTAEGAVSLPLVGNINVAGLRLNDLSNEISGRLQRRADGAERPVAAIEILQYRPFSIVGDVQRPGEYAYHPGLTVLQAVGIAGGYYRPEVGLLRLDRDMALAKGEIRTLSLKQNRLLAREARLTAILAGREDIPAPPEFADKKDDPTISAIMEGERAALAVEYDQARSETVALKNIKALYQEEIGSLRGQMEALTQEESTIQAQLKEVRTLSAKGLALMPTLFNLERALAQIDNEKISMATAIVRANENITLAEQRLNERAYERSRVNTRDLQQTKDEISEVRARLRTAGDLLTEAQITAPAEARERLAERTKGSSFTLLRKDGETTHEIVADETTMVAPGDVIKVPMIRPMPYASSNSVNLTRAETGDKAQP